MGSEKTGQVVHHGNQLKVTVATEVVYSGQNVLQCVLRDNISRICRRQNTLIHTFTRKKFYFICKYPIVMMPKQHLKYLCSYCRWQPDWCGGRLPWLCQPLAPQWNYPQCLSSKKWHSLLLTKKAYLCLESTCVHANFLQRFLKKRRLVYSITLCCRLWYSWYAQTVSKQPHAGTRARAHTHTHQCTSLLTRNVHQPTG